MENELTREELIKLKPGVLFWVVKKKTTKDVSNSLYRGVIKKIEVYKNEICLLTEDQRWSTNFRHFFLNYWDAYRAMRKIWG